MLRNRLLVLLGVFALVFAACGTAATPSPSASESAAAPSESASAAAASETPSGPPLAADQVLHMDITNEPPTLDPNMAQDSVSIAVLHATTRALVYFDKDLNTVPELADSWDVSADAKTITFHLKDAKYSNGDPIVAGDLVYGWKRTMDPRLAAPYAYILGDVAGAGDLLALAGKTPAATDAEITAALAKFGVAAPDDKTFVVTLSHPATYFLAIAANWVTVPVQEKWITQKNATEAANFVASGPFMMTSWDHNSKIVLKPNPNWYGTKPTLTEIDMSMLNDPAAAQASYEAGELDLVQAPGDDIKRIKADPTLGPEVKEVAALTIAYYGFNTKKGPTANKLFRQALNESVDKNALLEVGWGGTGIVADSYVPPGIPGYQPDLGLKYDVADAKTKFDAALKELGISDVSKLPVLSFGYNSGAGHETRVQFLADQWKKNLGIQTKLEGLEWAVFLQKRHKGEFDISRNAWGADYPNPRTFLNDLFFSTSGNNDEGYNNPAYDALINQAAAEPDAAKSIALYNQAQTILVDDAPGIPLRFASFVAEIKPYVVAVPTAQDNQNYGDNFPELYQILQH